MGLLICLAIIHQILIPNSCSQGQIKLKESTLEISSNAFLEKEKDLHYKIEELEQRMEVLNQTTIQYENELEEVCKICSVCFYQSRIILKFIDA